ncbi:MAG TPA: nuclear transport factor 2 family protein [Acidimicrobiales bacterium]|nr:nuclear transport factor 2 family protein [Acidimicrobiales bacterium]
MADIDPVQRMVSESEIRNLVARLGQLADDGDLDEYLSLWMEDGEWERPDGDRFRGHAALLARINEDRASGVQGPGTASRHVNTTLWVRVDGPDDAHAESYWLYLRNANTAPVIQLTGRYVDTFRRTSDGWKFASRRIVADVN